MFGDLFNGLLGHSEYQAKGEQLQYARDEAIRQRQVDAATYYQHMLNQQQARINRGMANQSATTTSTLGAAIKLIPIGEYDELTSLSNWCQSVHPEVYEEWRAMQDLKKASEDEST